MAGPERKSRLISEREKRVIAYHEGGHALVGARAAQHRPGAQDLDHPARPRARLHAHAAHRGQVPGDAAASWSTSWPMLLGGRTAEELIFADPTTGAQNDIDRATTIARQMVTEFGMSDSLGPDAVRPPAGRGVPRPRLHLDARLLRGGRGEHRRRGARAHRLRARGRRATCSSTTARSSTGSRAS